MRSGHPPRAHFTPLHRGGPALLGGGTTMAKHSRKQSEVPLFSEEHASPSVVEGPNARPVSPDVASSRQRNKGPPPEQP